uniref:Uncharacterized protein n=1 Tax=Anguilla anguilla TaxID=7936 RepID=A0A0E9SZV2_ANGAN
MPFCEHNQLCLRANLWQNVLNTGNYIFRQIKASY